MEYLIIIVIVLGVLSALVDEPASKRRKGGRRRRRKPQRAHDARSYELVDSLLSPAELNFYRLLVKVLQHPSDPGGSPQAVVMTKVRVSDLVQVRKGMDSSRRHSAFNRIKSKHVDFVLCEPVSMEVLCVIELDDKSHRRQDRQARDELMDSIYAAVGLAMVHVDCRRGYSMREVAEMIRGAMGRPA